MTSRSVMVAWPITAKYPLIVAKSALSEERIAEPVAIELSREAGVEVSKMADPVASAGVGRSEASGRLPVRISSLFLMRSVIEVIS